MTEPTKGLFDAASQAATAAESEERYELVKGWSKAFRLLAIVNGAIWVGLAFFTTLSTGICLIAAIAGTAHLAWLSSLSSGVAYIIHQNRRWDRAA